MIITDDFKGINKVQLLIDIVRADEALATLIEHEYDDEEQTLITMEVLEFVGIHCELQYGGDEYEKGYTIFDEFSNIIQGLHDEIKDNNMIINKNHSYGYK